jgi:hypothetical protein
VWLHYLGEMPALDRAVGIARPRNSKGAGTDRMVDPPAPKTVFLHSPGGTDKHMWHVRLIGGGPFTEDAFRLSEDFRV